MTEPPEQEPPKITFPCRYIIKVVGTKSTRFNQDILEIVRRHDPTLESASDEVDPTKPAGFSVRDSREGKYRSLSVQIWATGETQLKALHTELMAHTLVKMVL